MPWPKARCSRALSRSWRNSSGWSKRRGSRLAAAVEDHEGGAGGEVDAADLGGDAGEPEVALDRALEAEDLLDEARDAARGARAACSAARGRSPSTWNAAPSIRTVVSWPAAKRLAASRTTSMTSGVEPSLKVAGGQAGEDVVAGLAPALLDVGGEAPRRGTRAGCAPASRRWCCRAPVPFGARPGRLRNGSWSSSGTPSRSAMTSRVNGPANSSMNSHAAAVEELVDLAVGESPHRLLVLLQPLRREQPHEQARGAPCGRAGRRSAAGR